MSTKKKYMSPNFFSKKYIELISKIKNLKNYFSNNNEMISETMIECFTKLFICILFASTFPTIFFYLYILSFALNEYENIENNEQREPSLIWIDSLLYMMVATSAFDLDYFFVLCLHYYYLWSIMDGTTFFATPYMELIGKYMHFICEQIYDRSIDITKTTIHTLSRYMNQKMNQHIMNQHRQ